MSRKEIIELAKKNGIHVPSGLEEREALYYIADKLGLVNFQYNEEGFILLEQVLEEDESYETLTDDEEDLEVPPEDENSSSYEEGPSEEEMPDLIDEVNDGEKAEVLNEELDMEDILSQDSNSRNEAEKANHQQNTSNQNEARKKEQEKKEQSSLDDQDSLSADKKEEQEDTTPEKTDVEKSPKKENGYQSNRVNDGNHPNTINQSNDSTQYANSNYQHQQKVNKGKKKEDDSSKDNKKSKGQTDKESKNNSQPKKKVAPPKGGNGKLANHLGDGKSPFQFSDLKNKIIQFFMTHPEVLVILIVSIILILIILIVVIGDSGKGGKSGTRCNYELKGVVETGTVSLNDLQVELINCDGTPNNYTVLGTVDFEKYVIGVALAEIGANSPDEAIKAQIVAARNFALTRNSGMCPGGASSCFYGYNLSNNKIRMRVCEADQVYWDYTKNIYRQDRGAISLYSPEVDASSGTLWHSALSSERIEQIQALAEEVRGVVLLDQNDSVLKTSYNSTVSQQFQSEASAGKSYEEILANQYGSANFYTSICSSYGAINYGDYVLDSTGQDILHQDLASFLQSKGTSLDEFNELIADNVEDAGYGSRAGVVVSAVTLIGELGNQYGVKLPYFWGGGHAGAIQDYANGNWGSSACHTYANNQSYNYCGLDCSGFVPWAIRNGGYNLNQALLAGAFYNSFSGAEKVSLKATLAVLEPGDLIESKSHITLVVDVDEASRQYIVAHASGNETGILFSRFSFDETGYWGVKMDGYYNNPTNIRSR